MSMGPKYMLSTFASHVGEQFQLHDPSGESRTVELVDAIGQASRRPTQERTPDTGSFSIVFQDHQGSTQSYLQQSVYRIEHAVVGQIDMFLVPIGPDADGNGMRYEAVFASAT